MTQVKNKIQINNSEHNHLKIYLIYIKNIPKNYSEQDIVIHKRYINKKEYLKAFILDENFLILKP